MKDIPGYEGLYAVTEDGNIWSFRNSIFLKQSLNRSGYPKVKLSGKTHRVHRLIGKVLVINPDNKPCINHINGIRHDNRAENLEWCTQKENVLHGWKCNGRVLSEKQRNNLAKHRFKLGNRCGGRPISYIPVTQITKDGNIISIYNSACVASKETNIHAPSIRQCAIGKRPTAGGFIWKYA